MFKALFAVITDIISWGNRWTRTLHALKGSLRGLPWEITLEEHCALQASVHMLTWQFNEVWSD